MSWLRGCCRSPGQDPLTVNRKYRDQWTVTLASRLMICSNELPQLGDASSPIAGRFVPLLLDRSWYGKEDLGLEPALRDELTGILNWSLDGLGRIARHGAFTRPPRANETITALQDLASPVDAFVRDRCHGAAGHPATAPGKFAVRASGRGACVRRPALLRKSRRRRARGPRDGRSSRRPRPAP
jgi:putative DNA primase/helicase